MVITMQKYDSLRDRGDCCRHGNADGGSFSPESSEQPRFVKCGCGEPMTEHSFGLKGYPLASVYSALQDFREIYDLDTALKRGTIFGELDLPFYGSRCTDCNAGNGGVRNVR